MYFPLQLCSTYAINGGEYDIRKVSEDCSLLCELRRSLGIAVSNSTDPVVAAGKKNMGHNSSGQSKSKWAYIINELKPGLSSIAYKHVRTINLFDINFII
jgi:hypothetical protein